MTILINILGFIWALPITLIGLLALLTAGWPVSVMFDGWAVVIDVKLPFYVPNMKAVVYGNLVMCRPDVLFNGNLRKHELEHVRQCNIFGPFIIILYPMLSLLAWICYNKPYEMNWLEIMARIKASTPE